MGHGPAGDRFKDLTLGQLVQEFVQVALEGLHGLLENKEHQHSETELALACKVLRSHPVARQESWVAQFSAESLDQGDEITWDVMSNGSHPQGDRETAGIGTRYLSTSQSVGCELMSRNFNGSGARGWGVL